jgi:hypothetical protein
MAELAGLKRSPKINPIDPRRAYMSGVKAKSRGWFRLSPFYENPPADKYFYAGFDNLDFDKVKKDE